MCTVRYDNNIRGREAMLGSGFYRKAQNWVTENVRVAPKDGGG